MYFWDIMCDSVSTAGTTAGFARNAVFAARVICGAAWLLSRFRAFTKSMCEEIPFVYVDTGAITEENVNAGKQLMSPDYFNCFSCHVQGDKNPEGPPEGWAPNLAMAKHRLNPEWIVQWIHDPQKIQPGTKMPSFYPGGPDDIFGGDEERQIRAIRDYLMVLGEPARQSGTQQMVRRENGTTTQ